jgi:hypothetical protein
LNQHTWETQLCTHIRVLPGMCLTLNTPLCIHLLPPSSVFHPHTMEPATDSWPQPSLPSDSLLDSTQPSPVQKKPRHRHTPAQLASLNELYEKTEHPSLEQRVSLAEQLGMYVLVRCYPGMLGTNDSVSGRPRPSMLGFRIRGHRQKSGLAVTNQRMSTPYALPCLHPCLPRHQVFPLSRKPTIIMMTKYLR